MDLVNFFFDAWQSYELCFPFYFFLIWSTNIFPYYLEKLPRAQVYTLRGCLYERIFTCCVYVYVTRSGH